MSASPHSCLASLLQNICAPIPCMAYCLKIWSLPKSSRLSIRTISRGFATWMGYPPCLKLLVYGSNMPHIRRDVKIVTACQVAGHVAQYLGPSVALGNSSNFPALSATIFTSEIPHAMATALNSGWPWLIFNAVIRFNVSTRSTNHVNIQQVDHEIRARRKSAK